MENNTICEKCGAKIRVFKTRLDFNGRKLHLKCWKEQKNDYHANLLYESHKEMLTK
jgi:hypothetical protein